MYVTALSLNVKNNDNYPKYFKKPISQKIALNQQKMESNVNFDYENMSAEYSYGILENILSECYEKVFTLKKFVSININTLLING